jgi:hypothetical protein
MPAETATSPRLMTEIERQQHYLRQLPPDYEFPLFSGRQAVESQRRSGYKDTARAAREIVDNAFDAGAENVWIVFNWPEKAGRLVSTGHEARCVTTALCKTGECSGKGCRRVCRFTWVAPVARRQPRWQGCLARRTHVPRLLVKSGSGGNRQKLACSVE